MARAGGCDRPTGGVMEAAVALSLPWRAGTDTKTRAKPIFLATIACRWRRARLWMGDGSWSMPRR